jgi:hypothetical protein
MLDMLVKMYLFMIMQPAALEGNHRAFLAKVDRLLKREEVFITAATLTIDCIVQGLKGICLWLLPYHASMS